MLSIIRRFGKQPASNSHLGFVTSNRCKSILCSKAHTSYIVACPANRKVVNATSSSIGRLIPGRLISLRYFGISDTIMNFAASKAMASQESKFPELVSTMIKSPAWNFKAWKGTLESTLNSWTMMIPGMSSAPEVQEIQKFKVMLDVMTPEELLDANLITMPARERIAKASGKTVDDVNRLLYFYKQSLIIATWLRMKHEKGETLPNSQREMQDMQLNDRRMKEISTKIMMPAAKRRKGRASGF